VEIEGEVGTDFLIFCPYHGNFRTPAGEVAKESGHFYCFGCQESRTLAELIMKVSDRNYFEALRLIDSKGKAVDIEETVTKILGVKHEFEEFDPEIIDRLHRSAHGGRGYDYFMSRGINWDSIIKYQLGYSAKQDMVTVPVHSPDGMCVGFVGRSIDGKVFKNSTDLPRGNTFFNIHRAKVYDRVFAQESTFDAILLEQAGGHAVASMGSSLSRAQKVLLDKYFRSIMVVKDNDEAGRRMAEAMETYFGNKFTPITLEQDVKDVGDLTHEQRVELVLSLEDEVNYALNNT